MSDLGPTTGSGESKFPGLDPNFWKSEEGKLGKKILFFTGFGTAAALVASIVLIGIGPTIAAGLAVLATIFKSGTSALIWGIVFTALVGFLYACVKSKYIRFFFRSRFENFSRKLAYAIGKFDPAGNLRTFLINRREEQELITGLRDQFSGEKELQVNEMREAERRLDELTDEGRVAQKKNNTRRMADIAEELRDAQELYDAIAPLAINLELLDALFGERLELLDHEITVAERRIEYKIKIFNALRKGARFKRQVDHIMSTTNVDAEIAKYSEEELDRQNAYMKAEIGNFTQRLLPVAEAFKEKKASRRAVAAEQLEKILSGSDSRLLDKAKRKVIEKLPNAERILKVAADSGSAVANEYQALLQRKSE